MPINITQSQNIQLDNGFVSGSGSFDFKEVAKDINALLLQRGEMFKDEWINILNQKNQNKYNKLLKDSLNNHNKTMESSHK